jgi:plasmid stabilization system protein ParE
MSRILWSTPAVEDLQDIAQHIAEDSPSAASRFVDRIDEAVSALTSQPRLGRIVPELRRHSITRYRELIVSPWRLFYREEKGQVFVLAVIDGRRNMEDILLRRLMRE